MAAVESSYDGGSRNIPISSLDHTRTPPANSCIKTIVTLLWPFSSSTESLALLLAEPDFRLRNQRGQIRVQLEGPAASALVASKIASGDALTLDFEGGRWVHSNTLQHTPGRSVEGELLFKHRLKLQAERNGLHVTSLNVDDPRSPIRTERPATPETALPSPPPRTSTREAAQHHDLWSSPDFFHSNLDLNAPFFAKVYDRPEEEDGIIQGRLSKRTKYGRRSSEWRYIHGERRSTEYEFDSYVEPTPSKIPPRTASYSFDGATDDFDRNQAPPESGTDAEKTLRSSQIASDATPDPASGVPKTSFSLLERPNANSDTQLFHTIPEVAHVPRQTLHTLDTSVADGRNVQRARPPGSPRLMPIQSPNLPSVSPFPTSPMAQRSIDDHLTSQSLAQSLKNPARGLIDQIKRNSASQSAKSSESLGNEIQATATSAPSGQKVLNTSDSQASIDGQFLSSIEPGIRNFEGIPLSNESLVNRHAISENTSSPAGAPSESVQRTPLAADSSQNKLNDLDGGVLAGLTETSTMEMSKDHSQDIVDITSGSVQARPSHKLLSIPNEGRKDSQNKQDSLYAEPRPNSSTKIIQTPEADFAETISRPEFENDSNLLADQTKTLLPEVLNAPIGILKDPITPDESQEALRTPKPPERNAIDLKVPPLPLTPQVSDLQSQEIVRSTGPRREEAVQDRAERVEADLTPDTDKSLKSNVPASLSRWFSSRRSSRIQNLIKEDQISTQPSPSKEGDPKVSPSEPIAKRRSRRESRPKAGLTTPLSYYAPSSALETYLGATSNEGPVTVDIFAIVFPPTPEKPIRAKSGPKDYSTTLHVTDTSSHPQTVQVQCFRPYQKSLPIADVGDVIVLRNFLVRSRKRKCFLLSTEESAWHVWRFAQNKVDDTESQEESVRTERQQRHMLAKAQTIGQCNGPPVEVGIEEHKHACELREWFHSIKATLMHGSPENDIKHQGRMKS